MEDIVRKDLLYNNMNEFPSYIWKVYKNILVKKMQVHGGKC